MGLLKAAELLELGERVADGGGRHPQPRHVGEAGGADRLAGIDVFGDQGGENLCRPGRKLRMFSSRLRRVLRSIIP